MVPAPSFFPRELISTLNSQIISLPIFLSIFLTLFVFEETEITVLEENKIVLFSPPPYFQK